MQTIEILDHLIAFDTTSSKSNKPLVDWVVNYLDSHGVTARLYPNDDQMKFNLIATIGPRGDDGIVLSGHTDVVPVIDQPWTTDPFKMTQKNDRLYGRGTCDMKGYLACVLAAVPAMTHANLSRPFHIAFSYDEEVGGLGIPLLVPHLGAAAAALVGEPTNMKIVDRHKGVRAEQVTFTGVAAHSSLPHLGVSAVEYATTFAQHIYAMGRQFRDEYPDDPVDSINITTVNVGRISGGTAGNIIPDQCTLDWNFRCSPGGNDTKIVTDAHSILHALRDEMQSLNPACNVTYEQTCAVPPLNSSDTCFAKELCFQLTGENNSHAVNYGTDGGELKRAGIPTIICGPGSIEQAHKPDEFIEISELKACDAFLASLTPKYTG